MKHRLLVDSLHIKAGGALGILDYLIDNLNKSEIDYILLKDIECPKLKSEDDVKNIVIMSSETKARNAYFKQHKSDFDKVLCFGNIPPCVKMGATVYTYMHNVSLLYIPSDYDFKRKAISWLKRAYIRHYSKFTDAWIVQTQNTENLLRKYVPCANIPIYQLPFFYLPDQLQDSDNEGRDDYVFIGEHTRAKGDDYLVEAWAILAERGFKKKLHLTLAAPEMVEPIKKAILRGANIENHGHIPFNEVVQLYHKSKAIVYPSLNESLGLGIVEALTAGCDVIGCDLPYIHSICTPSGVFSPKSPEAIADAVIQYETGYMPKSQLLIKDSIHELISLLI